MGVNAVWNDTYLQETQGSRYQKGEVFVVDDVYQQGFSQCRLDLYKQSQIKAFITVIYANLNHLNEYFRNLFRVLASYQAHYPEPPDDIKALLEEADLDYIEQDFPKLCSSLSSGTQRIQAIVSSLCNFSRLDEAAVKFVDIHEGIESTLLILQHRFKDSDSKVSIEIVKDLIYLPLVECHSGQINQVFMNAIGNAIDELQPIEPAAESE